MKIIKNTHKKNINCLKLTQKVKNIKNKYQKPLRRSLFSASAPPRHTYNRNPLRSALESFFGRFASRHASTVLRSINIPVRLG
ncbi:hypothetical protein Hanom_Chr08g00721871 [Helianthus anomalus]